MIERIMDIQKVHEKIKVFTLLGIRFWDQAQNTMVSDYLEVSARPQKAKFPIIRAFRTFSGVYAFQELSGMKDMEYLTKNPFMNPKDIRRFIIEIEDKMQRFLPVIFSVDLPLPYTGIFLVGDEYIPYDDGIPGFYLFSAPTRSASSGLAAVRGQLIERAANRPAAHAVLEIKVNNRKWYGITDKQGCFAVLFPYPVFITTFSASLPDEQQPLPLNEQIWDLTTRVRYYPEALEYPGDEEKPELRSIFGQHPGVIWSTTELYSSEMSSDLIFGQELILRTGGLSESILWIDKEGSPL